MKKNVEDIIKKLNKSDINVVHSGSVKCTELSEEKMTELSENFFTDSLASYQVNQHIRCYEKERQMIEMTVDFTLRSIDKGIIEKNELHENHIMTFHQRVHDLDHVFASYYAMKKQLGSLDIPEEKYKSFDTLEKKCDSGIEENLTTIIRSYAKGLIEREKQKGEKESTNASILRETIVSLTKSQEIPLNFVEERCGTPIQFYSMTRNIFQDMKRRSVINTDLGTPLNKKTRIEVDNNTYSDQSAKASVKGTNLPIMSGKETIIRPQDAAESETFDDVSAVLSSTGTNLPIMSGKETIVRPQDAAESETFDDVSAVLSSTGTTLPRMSGKETIVRPQDAAEGETSCYAPLPILTVDDVSAVLSSTGTTPPRMSGKETIVRPQDAAEGETSCYAPLPILTVDDVSAVLSSTLSVADVSAILAFSQKDRDIEK